MSRNLGNIGGVSACTDVVGYDVVCPDGGVIERGIQLKAGAEAVAAGVPGGRAVVIPVIDAFQHRVTYVART